MISQLWVLNATEQTVATLGNELPGACPMLALRQIKQAADGGGYSDMLTLSVPADHADAVHLKEGYHLLFKDVDGYWQEYKIVDVTRQDDDQSILDVTAEHAFYELLGDQLTDIRPTNVTAASAVTQALANSRWQLATAHNLGTNSCRIYYESALSALCKIATIWGGELQFRVGVSETGTITRWVDILTRRGATTGKRFELGKDITSIKTTVNTQNMVTALYGRGRGVETDNTENPSYGRRLKFDIIEWKTENGYPLNKPLGQEWIGDDVARLAYPRSDSRHIYGIVTFDDETDPANLLLRTYNELQRLKKPRMTVDMDVIALEELSGYEHEKVRLGDTVSIINTSVSPAYIGDVRVININRSLLDPSDCKIILGTFTPDISGTLAEIKVTVDEARQRTGTTISILNNEIMLRASQEEVNSLLTRIEAAELKVAPGEIIATVMSSTEYAGDYDALLSTAQSAQATASEAMLQLTPESIKAKVGQIGGVNLLKNSSFRFGTSGWGVVGATNPPFTTVSSGGRTDNNGLRIDGAYGVAKYVRQVITGSWDSKIIASAYYTCFGIVYGTTNPLVKLYVEAVDADGGVYYYSADDIIGTKSWRRVSLEIDPTTWTGSKVCTEIRVHCYGRDFTGYVVYDDVLLQEGDKLTAWSPNPNELLNSSVTITDDTVQIDTYTLELKLKDPSGEVVMEMSATSTGFAQLTVDQLNLTGQITTGNDGNIDTFQSGTTLYVGKSRTPDGLTQFTTLSSALANLGKRLKDATVVVNVDAGTYNEAIDIVGFYGQGTLTIRLAGGTANTTASKAIFVSPAGTRHRIRYNAIPVTIEATTSQTNNSFMPQLLTASGWSDSQALMVYYNTGRLILDGICVVSPGAANAMTVTSNANVNLMNCCFEGADAASYGVYIVYSSAYMTNCRGTNAGTGTGLAGGAHLIRKGFVPNGAVAVLTNGNGAYHDNGGITATSSTGTSVFPTAQTTTKFSCDSSRSLQGSKWRDNTDIYQGNYGYGTHYGAFRFGSAVAALSGKTIIDARLYLKRQGKGGRSGKVPIKLFATTLSSIPSAWISGTDPTTGSGTVLGELAWNEGGWYDIPITLTNAVKNGYALCLYNGSSSSNYAILYGNGADKEPVLEVTYQ